MCNTWQHDSQGNSRWIALGLTKSRWWIGTAVTAIGAAVMLLSHGMGILLLLIALACFALAIGWDFFRWHWPFLPQEIEDQIVNGLALLSDPNLELQHLHVWQQQTREQIAKIWSPKRDN